MANQTLKEDESTFFEEDRDQPIPPENVVAYNELRSCADLHRMHSSGKLEIQPDFQRDVVWKADERARFIDSLVKRLPIPSMCFSLDYHTQKWKVIDGLQRMDTITSFLGDSAWRLADLPDIHPALRGRRNTDLRNGEGEARMLYEAVLDISIPVTVIRCSYDNDAHMRYLFTIFNRLNAGGVRLNNQEIRNCIYSGPFNDLLKRIDRDNPDWRVVRRKVWGGTDRFRSVEILLRALAFSQRLDSYDGNLAGFLNNYMLRASKEPAAALEGTAERLTKMAALARLVLDALQPGKKSLTIIEGLLVGIPANVGSAPGPGDATGPEWARTRAEHFATLPAYGVGARYALASAPLVRERLRQAITAFA